MTVQTKTLSEANEWQANRIEELEALLEAKTKAASRALATMQEAVDKAEAERDRLRGLIDEHNQDCIARCGEGTQEGVRCGYRPYFPRRCPECPRYDMIELAALEGE